MPDIQVSVTNKEAVALGSPLIICGNNDYKIHFTFDAEWKDLQVRTARFSYTKDGVPAYIDKPFSGATVDVPVLSGLSLVEVGVYAGDLHTTTGARIPCKRSVLCAGAVPQEEPPEDLYNTVLQECNEAIARNEHTKEELVAGGLVENLKELNNGDKFSFWVGTQAEYDELAEKQDFTLYLITDDPSAESLRVSLANISKDIGSLFDGLAEAEQRDAEILAAIPPIERRLDDLDTSVAGLTANSNLIPLYVRASSGTDVGFSHGQVKTVKDISKHTLFVINFNDIRTSVLCIRNGAKIRGQATFTDPEYITEYIIELSLDFDQVTYSQDIRRTHNLKPNAPEQFTLTTGGEVIAAIYAIGGF